MDRFAAIVLCAVTLTACGGGGEKAALKCSATCNGKLPPDGACVAYNPLLFSDGTLTCVASTCELDFTGCTLLPTQPTCTADCNGQLPSDASCAAYNPTVYTGGTLSCYTPTCQLNLSGCLTNPGELATCTGTGQGDCQAGLTCVETAALGGKICMRACDLNASLCTADEYCETSLKAQGAASNAFCFAKVAAHSWCLSADACSGTNLLCEALSGVNKECVPTCDGAAVGTTATCGTETCLAGPRIELQQSGGNPVVCTVPWQVDVCDGAKKYSCDYVGNGINGLRCVRHEGVCGRPAEILASFTDATIQDAVNRGTASPTNPSPATLCDFSRSNVFCADSSGVAAPAARVECVQTRKIVYPVDKTTSEPFGCDIDADCFGLTAACVSASEVGKVCGSTASLCVPFCESPDGQKTWNCPNEKSCKVPSVTYGNVGPLVLQYNGNTPLTCAVSTTCNQGAGFACVDFGPEGKICARNRKVCQTP